MPTAGLRAGLAGLSAALDANAMDAKVVVLEKPPAEKIGRSSRTSGGNRASAVSLEVLTEFVMPATRARSSMFLGARTSLIAESAPTDGLLDENAERGVRFD